MTSLPPQTNMEKLPTMAGVRVHVNGKLVKRLENAVKTAVKGVFGVLLGVRDVEGNIHILSAATGTDGAANQLEEALLQSQDIIKGLSPVGIWFKMNQGHLSPVVKQVWEKIVPKAFIKKVLKTGKCIVYPVGEIELQENQMSVEGALNGPHFYTYCSEDGTLSSINVISDSQNILDRSLLVRLRAGQKLEFELGSSDEETRKNIRQVLAKMERKLKSELTVFHVKNSRVLLPPAHCDLIDENGVCEQILDHIATENEDVPQKKSSKRERKAETLVGIEMLVLSSGQAAADLSMDCSPVIQHVHDDIEFVQIPLVIDVALNILPDMAVNTLGPTLVEASVKQLKMLGESLLKYFQKGQFYRPQVHHFKPPCSCHIYSIVYPDIPEEKLVEYRKSVQHLLVLPTDQPLMRRSVTYTFPNEPPGVYLTNTHLGLAPSGVDGGHVYMVDGTYAYHHYMQDRFDDNKWGCAYRSLQTLVSWLRYQGYTTKPVPTHPQIQQALVDVGDKEKNFVGSRQWIGSTEVSYVLDHMFGVSSKILFVSSGAEMPTKARELAMHFQQHGSPVMIGGGVLAHTILGVDFNDVTGDVKWLILDPHYTGAEDLKVIQDKGWCGWKGPKFWDQNAYYNMCLPQRPKMV